MGRAELLLTLAAVALVVGTITLAVLLASVGEPTVGRRGPPPPAGVSLASSTVAYGAKWDWYNFTVGSVAPSTNWSAVVVEFAGNVLGGPGNTSTLLVYDPTGDPIAGYVNESGVWWTASTAPVAAGQVLSLQVDHWLAGGSVTLSDAGPTTWAYTTPMP